MLWDLSCEEHSRSLPMNFSWKVSYNVRTANGLFHILDAFRLMDVLREIARL